MATAPLARIAHTLRRAAPCTALLLLRTDPTTVLPLDGLTEAMPPDLCRPFWDNELLDEDYNKFAALSRTGRAATLTEATGGALHRSRRYAELYRPRGFGDELRSAFVTRDGTCWGIAALIREPGRPFGPRDRARLDAAAPGIADALRAAVTAPPPPAPPTGPALVVLDRAGDVQAVTPEARRCLAELTAETATGMAPVPEPVHLVAARARSGTGPAYARVRTRARGWLHLHATLLEQRTAPGEASVAVVITSATATDLAPLLALGYRLTGRELDVLGGLARGLSTAEITVRLRISEHTVRGHIKSLMEKVGVHSRTQLVARMFAEHYLERLEAHVHRRDHGRTDVPTDQW